MSETFEKSQLSEFFDVSSGCVKISTYKCHRNIKLLIQQNMTFCLFGFCSQEERKKVVSFKTRNNVTVVGNNFVPMIARFSVHWG